MEAVVEEAGDSQEDVAALAVAVGPAVAPPSEEEGVVPLDEEAAVDVVDPEEAVAVMHTSHLPTDGMNHGSSMNSEMMAAQKYNASGKNVMHEELPLQPQARSTRKKPSGP
jgi:hypothetical protein